VLTLEETKELVRHANIQTTSDIYGGLSLDAKRAAQSRLVNFVNELGKSRLWKQICNLSSTVLFEASI
jgi:hypothetical protein